MWLRQRSLGLNLFVIVGSLVGMLFLQAGPTFAQDFSDPPSREVHSLPNKWFVSVAPGRLTHNGVGTGDRSRTESVWVLGVGMGRRVAQHWTIDVTGISDGTIWFGAVRWRWQPTAGNSQNDHIYLHLGANALTAGGSGDKNRSSGGLTLGIGLDFLIADARALSLEGGVSINGTTGQSGGHYGPFPNRASASTVIDDGPSVVLYLLGGTRFGL